MEKKFKIKAEEIHQLLPYSYGYCFATDKITIEGMEVGHMYRVTPADENDSGWIFLSGAETQSYIDNPANWAIYDVNTIANYDPVIIDYLNEPVGCDFIRDKNNFVSLD